MKSNKQCSPNARTPLHGRLATRLKRHKQNQQPGDDEQGSRDVDRRRSVNVGLNRDDRLRKSATKSHHSLGYKTHSHDTENTVARRGQRVASTSLGCREQFRRVRVQDSVHDVAAEVVCAIIPK